MTTKTFPDFSAIAPDIIPYLRSGEHIQSVETPPLTSPKDTPDALLALMKLTGAKTREEIGEKGPPNAATVTDENRGVSDLNLYETLFGRDSLIVSHFLLAPFPKVAHATILALAKFQGTKNNMASEEEPGKIMHENRDPNSAIAIELHENNGWEFPYYGSVDASPLFVTLITAYVAQEGSAILSETYVDREGKSRTVLHALRATVDWMLRNMASNPDGTLEFCRKNPRGLPIQAWKDSGDSYFHKDGALANHDKGIASIEVQGYAYDALLSAAALYRREVPDTAEQIAVLESAAQKLKHTVFSTMWVEDERGGYFALGTDCDTEGHMRPLMIRTSNMGHLLSSGMLDGDDVDVVKKRAALVRALTSKEMLAASGVRTLASDEARFYPGAYHNGSVWLWDSYYISRGFRKHGFIAEADDLVQRLMHTVAVTHKFPEFARGGDSAEPELNTRIVDIWDENTQRVNRIEQPPQEIQAWTVAAYIAATTSENGGFFR